MKNNPRYIIIHCSDETEKSCYDQFDKINIYHRDERGFPISTLGYYIGYHRLITGGKNYKCKEDTDVGAHCNQLIDGLSINFQSLGICWGGDGDVEMPSETHYKLLREQVLAWMRQYSIKPENVRFHREYAITKTCPGSLLNKAWLDLLIKDDTIPQLKVESCVVERAIIEEQKKQIFNLQNLIKMITSLLKKI